MIHVGMDVHRDSTVVHFFDPVAEPKAQHRSQTVASQAQAIEAALRPLKGQCRVAFEVGTQAQWVAGIVRPLAAEVQVANPSRMPWLFRDSRKNDKLDARKLATLLYLNQVPQVYLPTLDVSAWRALINNRRSVIKRRTMIKNQIRALLRRFMLRCAHRNLWGRAGRAWLAELTFDAVSLVMMQTLTAELDFLDTQRERVEAQLDAVAATQPSVALLRTIPGVGPRTAEAIVAFADRADRFGDRKHFASYFGMTPTQDSSGRIDRHGHISKRGPSVVRWVLVEAVHQITRHCPAMRMYCDRIHRGRKDRKKKAIVATGRKVLTIAYAMLRDQVPFDARRVSGPAA